jgi:hypothetical protein
MMPQTPRGKRVSVQIQGDLLKALRKEYARLGRESNPRPPTWDDYFLVVLSLGLERLKKMADREALTRLENELFSPRGG